jgi:hypothetical protein
MNEPNSKSQNPNPKQNPKSKIQRGVCPTCPRADDPDVRWNLKFESWSLFGIWILGFGISVLHP